MPFERIERFADALLLGAQHVERDGIGVVRLQQLRTFVEQALFTLIDDASLLLVVSVHDVQLVQDHLLGLAQQVWVQFVSSVLRCNLLFYRADQYGRLLAVGPALLPTDANEVLVDPAVSTSVVRDDQA